MSAVSNTKPLRDLIQRVRDETGWSYERLSARSGGRMAKSTIHKIATLEHATNPLSRPEAEALADALGVRWELVRDADLAGHGLMEIRDDLNPDMTLLTELVRDMDQAARDRYLRMARMLAQEFLPAPEK